MATNLIDVVKTYLAPDIVDRAAAYVGESSPDTYRAMTGIVPTIVGALTSMASSSGGAQQIANMLDSGGYNGNLLNNLGSAFSGGVSTQDTISAGKSLMESLFGGKLSGVIDLIARSTGVRAGSASSLIALVAPIVMNVLSRQRAAAGGGVAGLATLLGDQRGFLGNVLPAGMSSLLGWSGFGSGISEIGSSAAGAVSRAGEAVTIAERRPAWLIPGALIAAIVLLGLGYLLWRAAPVTDVASVATRKLAELQLPGGMRISVPEGAFNFSLATWLGSTSDTAVPKRFVFDNLNFESGSTGLTPESRPTVDSLVAILKAYPAVAVALEGYTDSSGDAEANKKLSLDRAVAVKDLLVAGGVADSRITTAGLGAAKPVASNDTEDGRAKNRRLELVVEKR